MNQMSKWLIIIGAAILMLGLIMHFAPGLLRWFGRLPGDIRVEEENTKIFIPITSMIIISVVLTILINLLKK
jgi:hypothetical protein